MPAGTLRSRRFVCALPLVAAAFAWQPLWAKESYLRRWPDNLPTPPLALSDPAGQEWNLQRLRGKVVVLNFWASWCAPCIDELPLLNDLAHSAAETGELVILGVNFKDSTAVIQRFSSAHPFQYPILLDKSGAYFKQWTTGVLPTTVLIDRHGRARWRIVGALDPADAHLKAALGKMLAERE